LEKSLSLDQFKLLAIQYQHEKKESKRKAEVDLFAYLSIRSFRIKKRCGYFGWIEWPFWINNTKSMSFFGCFFAYVFDMTTIFNNIVRWDPYIRYKLLPKNIERCQWVNRYYRIKVSIIVDGVFPKLYTAKAQRKL